MKTTSNLDRWYVETNDTEVTLTVNGIEKTATRIITREYMDIIFDEDERTSFFDLDSIALDAFGRGLSDDQIAKENRKFGKATINHIILMAHMYKEAGGIYVGIDQEITYGNGLTFSKEARVNEDLNADGDF